MSVKKDNKKTLPATPATFSMDQIPAALETVKQKIAAIKGDSEDGNTTDGNLEGFENIFEIKDSAKLIQAYASVNVREAAYTTAAKEMEIEKVPPFKLGKYAASTWRKDIKRAYIMANAEEELKKLTAAKEELEKHLSEEHKLANLMSNLSEIMS